MTKKVKEKIELRLAAMSMQENLDKLVLIGQATRDEQGRYSLCIAADNREIIRRLASLQS